MIIKTPPEALADRIAAKYEKELEVGLQLADLPGVVSYYGLDKLAGKANIVMEDFGASSLSMILERKEVIYRC